MKKQFAITVLLTLVALLGHIDTFGQVVVTGTALNISADSSNTIGASSSGAAIGKNNNVSSVFSYAFGEKNRIGQYATGSFVFGSNDTVTMSQSVCLGFHNAVSNMGGLALGRYLDADGSSGNFVIGEGVGIGHKLVSEHDHSLSIGFNSTKPTLFVSTSPNNLNQGIVNRTGKVAIGDVTPQAKLHIRSDEGEDAAILLEPANPSQSSSYLGLRDSNHNIIVHSNGKMEVSSRNNRLDFTSDNFSVTNTRMDLGRDAERKITVISGDVPALYSNAYKEGASYYRHTTGPSYAIEFTSNSILMRTALNQDPRTEITNWNNALSVKTNGSITLNGKIGVGIENTTTDYAMAVKGGLISTKVHIQEVTEWNDRVFDNSYRLMPLDELEGFVSDNRHLPGIPSEAEVKADGFDMAEMQSALLGKVEELVLYTIRQQKEIDSLREVVTVHFGYDECGNRTSRSLEFQRMEDDRGFASLTETFAGADMALFPNPTEGGFMLSLSDPESLKGATATLCSLDGTVLDRRAVTGSMEEFDLSGRPAGVYLLHLSSDGIVRTWKIIKRN